MKKASALGPLRTFANARFSRGVCASRQAASGTGSHWVGRRVAPTALRCSPRGRTAELAAFAALTALTALGHLRRVSSRSALRAPTPGLRFSPPHSEPAPGAACRVAPASALAWKRNPPTAKARPHRALRACEAPRSAGFMAARASALRELTRRGCLSAVSEANVASSATGHEAEHRRAAGRGPAASVARSALCGCAFAAPRPRTLPLNVRNGPRAVDRRRSRALEG